MLRQEITYSDTLPELQTKPKRVWRRNGKIRGKFYQAQMLALHKELVKLQKWVIAHDKRILILFEGMDTAGKSSTIKAFMAYLNPRESRAVALPKPTAVELTQWYFQRHIKQFPNGGEMVFFDRSWYNRAGIEMVFGFCTPEEHEAFYRQVNELERMIVDDGIYFFKFYLTISKETQANRIKDREQDPLKSWKLSRLDYESHKAYDTYATLRDKMFALSGTVEAPWCELDANDKKRARLNAVRYLLSNIDYDGKDDRLISGVDRTIVTLHKGA